MRTVAIGMSGGVDSAVSALMLQRQGYKVLPIHMTNWDHEEEGTQSHCEGQEALKSASDNCKTLGLTLHRASFIDTYWNDVFQPSLSVYESGVRTPNPDVHCNRVIKFGAFKEYISNRFPDVDYIASGHYARISPDLQLLRAADQDRDQTYFLSLVKRDQFSRVLFPLGDLLKTQVREIAAEEHLPAATRTGSRGLCFVGKRRSFTGFLEGYLPAGVPGDFVDVDTGKIVGRHDALWSLTLGQRARLSGMTLPYYVVGKDKQRNRILVGAGDNHPMLFSRRIVVGHFNWIGDYSSIKDTEVYCKTHSRGELIPCQVAIDTTGRVEIDLSAPVKGVTEGQVAALYTSTLCLGGGEIDHRYQE